MQSPPRESMDMSPRRDSGTPLRGQAESSSVLMARLAIGALLPRQKRDPMDVSPWSFSLGAGAINLTAWAIPKGGGSRRTSGPTSG